MTAEQEHLLDESILRVLDTQASRYGLNPQTIRVFVQHYGQHVSDAQIAARLRYLADEQIGFVRQVQATTQYHAYESYWSLTAAGVNHLRGAEA